MTVGKPHGLDKPCKKNSNTCQTWTLKRGLYTMSGVYWIHTSPCNAVCVDEANEGMMKENRRRAQSVDPSCPLGPQARGVRLILRKEVYPSVCRRAKVIMPAICMLSSTAAEKPRPISLRPRFI